MTEPYINPEELDNPPDNYFINWIRHLESLRPDEVSSGRTKLRRTKLIYGDVLTLNKFLSSFQEHIRSRIIKEENLASNLSYYLDLYVACFSTKMLLSINWEYSDVVIEAITELETDCVAFTNMAG
ncbi:hypothetical protein N836_34385 [Leptolyngbya sp. Heron Island J]|uniref:hypothetical protein n=1 Tax=Leptolyngbya sp. Heron Island J TaxID=1385935 RepID=UPI0003B95360|nr:hypothetical protein [Leptolyngbya sp. Heron Island J]ESA37995.1 hypothetical protein N836_34385 [Leptolyngbya sp. Heron Island J]